MLKQIKLYSTSGCHLCEQVEEMIAYLQAADPVIKNNVNLKIVEITEDDQLLQHYAETIPVLAYNNRELGWPFDIEQLNNWLLDH